MIAVDTNIPYMHSNQLCRITLLLLHGLKHLNEVRQNRVSRKLVCLSFFVLLLVLFNSQSKFQ